MTHPSLRPSCGLAAVLCLGLAGPAAASSSEAEPAGRDQVHVSGHTLSINGITEVPVGLFGIYEMKADPARYAEWGVDAVRTLEFGPNGKPVRPLDRKGVPEGVKMIVESWWDRYTPALVLTSPQDWEQKLVDLARKYGQATKDSPVTHHIEFWNEPFINWAVKPGVNRDGQHYDQTDTAEGKPVFLKGGKEPLKYSVWGKPAFKAVDARGTTDYQATRYAPAGVKEGDEFTFRGKQYKWTATNWVLDTTQVSYYAGQQDADFYRWMIVPFAKALKETNPAVQLNMGWGFHIFANDWDAWTRLYQPVLDDCWRWIDGVNEHHYGSDPRQTAASYEMVWAYALAKYDKRLRFYNTEAGSNIQPSPTPPQTDAEKTREQLRIGKAVVRYNLRDLIYMLAVVPDKAYTRFIHENQDFGALATSCVFNLLKPLRGKLVHVQSGNDKLWAAASRQDQQLVTAVFNEHPEEKAFSLRMDAPPGGQITGGSRRWIAVENDRYTVKEEPLQAAGNSWSTEAVLPGQEAAVWVLKLKGSPPSPEAKPLVTRTQHVAKAVMQRVDPGKTVELMIEVPEEARRQAESACLRVVLHAWDPAAGGVMLLNGKPMNLSGALPSVICELPVDPRQLLAGNTLAFQCPAQAKQGFTVVTAGLVTLERD